MFVRTDDFTIVNLDEYERIKASPEDEDSYVIRAASWAKCSWLFTASDERDAKSVIDLIEAALLRGAKCIDVRGFSPSGEDEGLGER